MDFETKNEFVKIREEFEEFRTKLRDELRRGVRTEFRAELRAYLTRSEAVKSLVPRYEYEEFRDYVYGTMFTKPEWLEWVHTFNGVLEEIRDMRQNRLIFEARFVDLDDKVCTHDKRMDELEGDFRAYVKALEKRVEKSKRR